MSVNQVLVQDYQGAGHYSVAWDGKDDEGQLASNGVYLYRLQAGALIQMRRMLLLK